MSTNVNPAPGATPPAPVPAPESGPSATPQVAPTPQAEGTSTSPPVEPQPPSPTKREEIYKQYYDQQPAVEQPPVAAPGEPLAQADAAPQPVAEPTDAQRLAQVEQTLTQVSEALTKIASGQPQPAQPTTPTEPQPQADWVEQLREGKRSDAEQTLANVVAKLIEPQLTQQASETSRVETELRAFVDDLRTKNSEIMPLEDLIGLKARQRLETAQSEGKIKSTDEYVKEYKAAVLDAVEDAKKIVQSYRAAGKSEGATVRQEVVGSSTLAPTPVESNRQPAPPQQVQEESAADYLAKREREALERRGWAN